MTKTLRHLRKRIAHTPVNGRGFKQYSRDLRQKLVSYAASQHTTGESYKEIAAALGLPSATLLNWCDRPSKRKTSNRPVGFRPVSLQADDGPAHASAAQRGDLSTTNSQPVVVVAGGVRIEGLTTDGLVEFVRRLGCLS